MIRPLLVRLLLASLILSLGLVGRSLYLEVGRTFSSDPTVWEPEIAAFEALDREETPPDDAILFVGSSSIRYWEELEEDMFPLTVIRRGFGGARISDLLHFSERIIHPYSPRGVVLHIGGNEIKDIPGNHVLTPEEAFADFQKLIAEIKRRNPDVPIYYLALRPARSPSPRDEFLEFIRKDFESQTDLIYLDAGAGLALADGSPDPDLIRWDQVHLNRKGYEIWGPPIRARLLQDLGPASMDE